MNVNTDFSYRLSYKEIIYMAMATDADKIYGLSRLPEEPNEEQVSLEWDDVKASLKEKGYLHEEEGELIIDSEIFEMIKILCHPKLLFVCKSKDEIASKSRNYYISGHIAINLEYEEICEDIYILTKFNDIQQLKESIREFFYFDSKDYEKTDQSVTLGIEELKEFLQSITDNDGQEQVRILYEKGMEESYIKDVTSALESKSCFRTMLVISFDEGTRSIVKEYIMYGGKKHLWQIEFREQKATITGSSNDIIEYKIAVLADALFYV